MGIGKKHGLFEFMRAFKTFSARKINKLRGTAGLPVWQSRFHDRIIRDQEELHNVREYIWANSMNSKKGEQSSNVSTKSIKIDILS
jgi:hypothetical protein